MAKELKKKQDPLAKFAPPSLPSLPKQKSKVRDQKLETRKKNSHNRKGK